jgi:EpsG family
MDYPDDWVQLTKMYIESRLFFAIIIFFILFCLRIVVSPSYFADYFSYELIINGAPNIFDNSLYEWLSYATFSIMGNLRDFGLDAVYWSYIYNFIFTTVLFFVIFEVSNNSLAGVMLVISLYAPLLSFVVLRAAPAYLIIALAIFYGVLRKRKTSSLLAIISTFYHISAVAPAFVIILLNIFGARMLKFSNLIFGISVFIGIFQIINFGMGVNIIPSGMTEIFLGYESIEKYSTYVDNPMDSGIYHEVYFCVCFLMVLLAKSKYELIDRNLSLYLYVLFGLHAVLMVSPVTAFRMSVFYMLPLLLVFPWGSFFNGLSKHFIYVASPLVLYFSFSGTMA